MGRLRETESSLVMSRRLLGRFKRGLKRSLRYGAGRRPLKPDPIYDDDTFFVSYPRSGSSWVRWLIAAVQNPEIDFRVQNINEVVPDMYTMRPRLASYPRPRMIKSHEAYNQFYPKVVYLYRDGRDVAVSYYNFYQTIHGYEGTFEQFLYLYIKGKVSFERWDDHVRSWAFRDHKIPFLAVCYEDLYENKLHVLTAVIRFLGLELSEEAVATAIRKCTFERHLENVKYHSPHYQKGYRGGVKGAPGKWREVFSEGVLAMFWDEMGPTMEQLGFNLEPK